MRVTSRSPLLKWDGTRQLKAMRVYTAHSGERLQSVLHRIRTPNQHILCEFEVYDRARLAGIDLVPARDNKSQYDPVKQMEALERYARRVPPPKDDDPDFVKAVANTFHTFGWSPDKGPKLRALPLDESIAQHLQLSKASGYPYFTSKAESFEKDLAYAQLVLAGARKPHPCYAEARIQHGSEGPKQRLVWVYPSSSTMVEALVARPLIDKFLKLRTPMVLGLHRYMIASRMVAIHNCPYRVALDYSKFDASISRQLIQIAFRVFKTWFDDDDEVAQKAMKCVLTQFIYTRIIMPDGEVYCKNRGVPSGSYFTQLVDSLVNYLAIQYVMWKVHRHPLANWAIMLLGDDSLFGLPHEVDLGRFAEVLASIGIQLNLSKTVKTKDEELEQFLGHTWDRGVVDRPMQELVMRMAFPERRDLRRDRKSVV